MIEYLHGGTNAEAINKTEHKVYATQMGTFLPNLVKVKAVIILLGINRRYVAETLMYLFPYKLAELIIVPVYRKVQHMKQAAISAIRSSIFLDRNTERRCSFCCVAGVSFCVV